MHRNGKRLNKYNYQKERIKLLLNDIKMTMLFPNNNDGNLEMKKYIPGRGPFW